MSLLDLITGGKSKDASNSMDKALQAIQNVKTPTAEELQYQIQQLVQTGKITPEQAKVYLQNPSAYASEIISQTGTNAQETSIESLLDAAKEGGLNPAEQAKISQILQQLGTQEKGANDAVVQKQAERGTLTGGETLAAQLQNNQAAETNANQAGLNTAAEGYNAMLQELTSAGQLGAGLQGQQNEQANTVAAATDAINRFNTAQQQQEENFNTTNKNEAQRENTNTGQAIEATNVANANEHARQTAQTHQQAYEDSIQKAAAEAGVSENKAQQDVTQGGQEAALIGGLVGAGGQAAAAGLTPPPVIAASSGGEIHDYLRGGVVRADAPAERAVVPGNSPHNDKIPAMLSENEVVLPRSVVQNPDQDKVMAFLNRIRKPKAPHPDDVATMLHAMGKVRESA